MKNDWIWIGIVLIIAIGLDLWLMPKIWRAGKLLQNWHPTLPKIPHVRIQTIQADENLQVEEKPVPEPIIPLTEPVETDAPRPDPAQPPIRLSLSLPPGAHLEISLRVKDDKYDNQA